MIWPHSPSQVRPCYPACRGAATALLLTVLFAPSCAPDAGTDDERADLLLVTFDTLRADHLGAYGYGRDTSPNVDALAAAGVRFETAYAPVSATSPAHATLFAARLPTAHGLVRNGLALDEREVVLAEVLGDAGYRTAAFVSSFPLSARLGFAQGFEHYDERFEAGAHPLDDTNWEGERVDGGFTRSGAATVDAAIAWIDRVGAQGPPVFLWLHLFDPHKPYAAPAPFHGRFEGSDDVDRYDEEVAYADAQIGRLLEAVRRARGERECLTVITADHGEAFGEHGYSGHNWSTFEEELGVPLVVHMPGRIAPRVVSSPAHLADIAPTVTALLGVAWPTSSGGGADLSPALRAGGELPERDLFLLRPFYPDGRPDRFPGERGWGLALRSGPWKFFEAPEEGRVELYHLGRDPGETKNLAVDELEVTAELAGRLDAWRRAEAARLVESEEPVAPEVQQALRALGYGDGE